MLRLRSTSSREWLERVSADLDTLLVDHAHCEKKAASTAINLLFRYPHRAPLLRPLSELAREELSHFEMVVDAIEARGRSFGRLEPSPYASDLSKIARTQEPARLLDTLLVCAMIEARSCERLRLLADNVADAAAARLFASLVSSEARHFATYVDLAREMFDADEVEARLDVVAEHEARVLASAPPWVRVHT